MGLKYNTKIAQKSFLLCKKHIAFHNIKLIPIIVSHTNSTSEVEKGSLLMQARANISTRNITRCTWDRYGW